MYASHFVSRVSYCHTAMVVGLDGYGLKGETVEEEKEEGEEEEDGVVGEVVQPGSRQPNLTQIQTTVPPPVAAHCSIDDPRRERERKRSRPSSMEVAMAGRKLRRVWLAVSGCCSSARRR
ncbi:hypothetical protein RIF29_09089 [Crotalaria pallida]|uniref:Uncharacterized protein n=1 Tax=Crotalaria pallida TaxID=3830 RepID=A0AAN9FU70_CROPI